jgi:hypothetical protein
MVEDQMTEDGFEVRPQSFVLAGTFRILCAHLLTDMQDLTEASQPCTLCSFYSTSSKALHKPYNSEWKATVPLYRLKLALITLGMHT